jgi:hypothetical protein
MLTACWLKCSGNRQFSCSKITLPSPAVIFACRFTQPYFTCGEAFASLKCREMMSERAEFSLVSEVKELILYLKIIEPVETGATSDVSARLRRQHVRVEIVGSDRASVRDGGRQIPHRKITVVRPTVRIAVQGNPGTPYGVKL